MNPNSLTVVSDGDLRRQLSFRVDNGFRGTITVKVRGDLSAQKYLGIVSALEDENQKRSRNDYIENPREQPYEPFRSIRINSVQQLEHTVERMGSRFSCLIVPTEWELYQAIAFRARELDVEVDTWSMN